jgi:hypothetical protein
LRLVRLYDAIESGVADLDDPALKERIAGLKSPAFAVLFRVGVPKGIRTTVTAVKGGYLRICGRQ